MEKVWYNVSMDSFFYVSKSFADLLKEPEEPKRGDFLDRGRESQLLYNEEVRILREEKDWYYVEALEQLSYRQVGFWAPYRGWVRKDDVSAYKMRLSLNSVVRSPTCLIESESGDTILLFGTYVKAEYFSDRTLVYLGEEKGKLKAGSIELLKKEVRVAPSLLTQSARLFNGCPYLFGGRSMSLRELNVDGRLTGVDCSGFVNLLFRAYGIRIPRDAYEQFIVSKKIKGKELSPGDLIFISPKDEREIVNHVMVYLGEGFFIEASSREKKVKEGSFMDRFSIEVSSIEDERIDVGESFLSFGRVLSDEQDRTDRLKKS